MKHVVTTRAPEPVTTSVHGPMVVAVGRSRGSVQLHDEELSPWPDLEVRMYPPELHHRVRSALCCGRRLFASYEGEHRGWTRRRALWLERREPAAAHSRPVVGITTFIKLYRVLLKHVLSAWLPDDAACHHYESLGAALSEGGRLPPWPGGWPTWEHLMDGLTQIDTPGLAILRRSRARASAVPVRLEPALGQQLDRVKLDMFQRLRALEVLGRLAETWRYATHLTVTRALGDQPTHIHGGGGAVHAWRQPGPIWLPLIATGGRDMAVTSITPTRWGSEEEDTLAAKFIRGRVTNAVCRQARGQATETTTQAIHQWLYRLET